PPHSLLLRPPPSPRTTLFPYTTLFRSLRQKQISGVTSSRKEEAPLMQILRLTRSIKQYLEEISDPNRDRPDVCSQCQARCPLIEIGRAHVLTPVTLESRMPSSA